MSNHQQLLQLLSFLICKKWSSWRCGIGLNILLPTAVTVVCLSYCRPHGSEYHHDITVSDHTKCVIPHCHTFGLLSHHGCLGAGGFRRNSPLDGATDLLSKIWQHITTVSFVSAPGSPKTSLYVSKWGRKNNSVHFKSVLECLLINSWSSSQHLHAGKRWRVIPSLPSHLVIHFTLVKWFRFGWQDWWGEILALLIYNVDSLSFRIFKDFVTHCTVSYKQGLPVFVYFPCPNSTKK